MHRRGIREMELGPVGEHQGDRVAPADASGCQSGGNRLHPGRVLPPAAGELVAAGADRGPVRVCGSGRLERLTRSTPVQSGGPLGVPGDGLYAHPRLAYPEPCDPGRKCRGNR